MPATKSEKLREECGVAGVFACHGASQFINLSLFALQHRGQEACGIVTLEDKISQRESQSKISNESPVSVETKLHVHKAFGLVSHSVTEDVVARLKGKIGVGHVRYSTQGGALVENIQPFQFKTILGPIAIAHNGNLINAREIRKGLEETGSVFQSTSDTEVIVHLIARSTKKSVRERIIDATTKVRGAYSLVIVTKDSMFAVRDPKGFRPLSLGKLGDGWIVASETCAFDLVNAEFVRDVKPGEIVEITENGIESWLPSEISEATFCSFEHIYFARPDSLVNGENIYSSRRRIGEVLAKECPAVGDLVMAIPDSGVAMAEGFSSFSKIPFQTGLVRNHYIGRTFIEPTQAIRDFGVRLKLNALTSVIKNKRVIVVDDSLVRGTTAARIFKLLRDAGAKEIHFRVGAPPITHSCYYGVDTPKRRDLLAAQMNVQEIRALIGADTIGFISEKGLVEAISSNEQSKDKNCGLCTACFTGRYPTTLSAVIEEMPTDKSGPGLYS